MHEAAVDTETFELDLRAARDGEQAGLSALFRAFQPRLLRYLRAREPRVAEDVASETWLAVAQRIGSFDGGPSAFSAWLFTIARQRLADGRRTTIRRRTDTVAEFSDSAGDLTAEQIALERLSAQAAVDLIVETLNHDQAEVVLLRILGDLSIQQVATIMGHDANWVGVTQHRALKRLSSRLGTKMFVTL